MRPIWAFIRLTHGFGTPLSGGLSLRGAAPRREKAPAVCCAGGEVFFARPTQERVGGPPKAIGPGPEVYLRAFSVFDGCDWIGCNAIRESVVAVPAGSARITHSHRRTTR